MAEKEYIERKAIMHLLCRFCLAVPCKEKPNCAAFNWLNTIPAADVEPVRRGRWNEESPDCLDGDSVYVCSACGETWTLIEGTPLDNNMHYCPNCGADMREES